MPTRLSDTDSDSLRVQIALLRRATPGRRMGLALALSADVITLTRAGIMRRHPGISDADAGVEFIRVHYGAELAAAVRARLKGDPPR